MKQQIIKWFNTWNDYSKCPKCKSKNQEDINVDRLDGYGSTILEYDIVCTDCGQYLNHYAYGYLDYPETKTGYIKWLWNYYKPKGLQFIKTIFETLKIIFST